MSYEPHAGYSNAAEYYMLESNCGYNRIFIDCTGNWNKFYEIIKVFDIYHQTKHKGKFHFWFKTTKERKLNLKKATK
ncbi:MAG: hypothetical protein L3J35_07755 [Bacteroidales bacterium]|nr:hypothetical protein [Bacteroidales bacterium]